jgi:predicted nucleic acid-binding protein
MTQPHLYDAGALIAIDKNDRRMWARYQVAVDDGRDIRVPAVVVGQAWRDSRRQVRLGKFLAGCRVDPVGLETGKAAGILCGRAETSDVVDATVVVIAAATGAVIWTSDPEDIKALADESGARPALVIRAV